ncbi:MAG TPA: HAD-IIA family hydrolase [Streptosporangiaceae bacterium]|nr:HAD-IIA family hydrolase [Streptosporangiaceae bacterium]
MSRGTCWPRRGGWEQDCDRWGRAVIAEGGAVTAAVTAPAFTAPAFTVPDRLFAGYALDLDGTVYLGDHALPGAVQTIGRLRELGCGVVFVTNKPLETAADYAAKLTRLGVPCNESDVVTATDALLTYLAAKHPESRVLAVAEPVVRAALHEAGHQVTDDPAQADVVVVSFDRTFDYAKLTAAYRAVRLHGAALVATNPDPYCPTPDGGLPDCAAMLAAIEACTGARAEAVTGKPSEHMVYAVLERLGFPVPAHTAMVGDRLSTDVAMATRAGMAGVLVLSGATGRGDLELSDVKPQYVVDDLTQLLPTQPAHPTKTGYYARG